MPIVLSGYQMQIGILSSYLKKHGHKVEYLEVKSEEVFDNKGKILFERIKNFSPDIIGFSSYDFNIETIKILATGIKRNFNIPIIVGGYYAMLSPNETISYPDIDIVCIGEGEVALEELLDRMEKKYDISDIKSLYVKMNGKIYKNNTNNLIENLDALPFVDRTIVNHQRLLDNSNSYLFVLASRGCPYNCTYCCNHAFKKLYSNSSKYVRFRSPGNVIAEIEECEKKYKFKKISFLDDLFTAFPKWLDKFAELYKEKFNYPFKCNIRPESATKEIVYKLKDMGCEIVEMGVETGDEMIRKTVLNRNMSNKNIIEAARNIKKVGLKLKTYNMIGIPHETISSLFKTIKLNFKIAPHFIQTLFYYPLKGTVLGKLCYEQDLVNKENLNNRQNYLESNSILKHKNIPYFVLVIAKWLNSAVAIRAGRLSILRLSVSYFFKNRLRSIYTD